MRDFYKDVNFYKFLIPIGLMPRKTKIIGTVEIPHNYFFDFLRGHFDGDGSFYSYWDKRWASSFLFYLSFMSASLDHILWLRRKIKKLAGPNGHAGTQMYGSRAYQLKYAKTEARIIINKIYHSAHIPKLERTYKQVYSALKIDNKHARVL